MLRAGRYGIAVGFVTLALSVVAASAYECAPPEGPDGWHRSAELQSPTSGQVAWAENSGNGFDVPFRGRVLLREHPAAASRIVLDLGHAEAGSDYCCSLLCVVDWSPDGRGVLIQGSGGLVSGDHVTYQAWIYDVQRMKLRRVPLENLRTQVETYWSSRLRHRLWPYLYAVGWETRPGTRIVVRAYGLGSDVVDLGTWSVALDGRHARLLGADSRRIVIPRVGILRERAE